MSCRHHSFHLHGSDTVRRSVADMNRLASDGPSLDFRQTFSGTAYQTPRYGAKLVQYSLTGCLCGGAATPSPAAGNVRPPCTPARLILELRFTLETSIGRPGRLAGA